MTRPEADEPWSRHPIEAIGLAVDVYRPWPIQTMPLPGGAIVYQTAPGGGAVFVRYGPGETLDAYLAGLGGALTTAEIVADEATRVLGEPARRATVELVRQPVGIYRDDGDGLVHEQAPESGARIVVTGFSYHGTPVLVGYRIQDEQAAEHWAVLERIVNSVGVL